MLQADRVKAPQVPPLWRSTFIFLKSRLHGTDVQRPQEHMV